MEFLFSSLLNNEIDDNGENVGDENCFELGGFIPKCCWFEDYFHKN